MFLQKEYCLRRKISISRSIRWLSQCPTCKWSSSCRVSSPRSTLGRRSLGCTTIGFWPMKGLSSWELTLTFRLMLFLRPWRSLLSPLVVPSVAHLVIAQGMFGLYLCIHCNNDWFINMWVWRFCFSEDHLALMETVQDMVTVMGTVEGNVVEMLEVKRVELLLITSPRSK